MSHIVGFARENGWAQLCGRAYISVLHRFRDSFTARKLCAPGFHVGRNPRLLGLSHMTIGSNLRAGDSLWLEAVTSYAGENFTPTLTIGDDVTFSDSVHIACIGSVAIGSGTLVGSHVIISDHSHGVYRGRAQSFPETPPSLRSLHSSGAVTIGCNVWIGDGVAVLPGATIGDGAVVGANAVVTGAIPPATIAIGAPARPIRHWSVELGEWLPIH